ncbi:hypothetical protein HD553DRAFT_322703 [Filobasidium floriforme]|uniref:uncharacterized protein n=1 Tax=Filobasidium floriforme TaxID=5210 RepID=UPI001E8E2EEC|nr:uncharacterized protein HD553DRAFT_322703 [Filobasidium floriforme]KAH8088229.1 hypothetical protein HD553DRAFT_322703 [Filobasidium floriforme]
MTPKTRSQAANQSKSRKSGRPQLASRSRLEVAKVDTSSFRSMGYSQTLSAWSVLPRKLAAMTVELLALLLRAIFFKARSTAAAEVEVAMDVGAVFEAEAPVACGKQADAIGAKTGVVDMSPVTEDPLEVAQSDDEGGPWFDSVDLSSLDVDGLLAWSEADAVSEDMVGQVDWTSVAAGFGAYTGEGLFPVESWEPVGLSYPAGQSYQVDALHQVEQPYQVEPMDDFLEELLARGRVGHVEEVAHAERANQVKHVEQVPTPNWEEWFA